MIRDLFPKQAKRVFEWNHIARTHPPEEIKQEALVLEELKEYEDSESIIESLDAICDVFVTGVYLEYLNPSNTLIDKCKELITFALEQSPKGMVDSAINEVLDSNDTKFWCIKGSSSTAIVGEAARIEEDCGLKITTRLTKDRIVFLDSNSKVRKPTGYKEPNLGKILEDYNLKQEVV